MKILFFLFTFVFVFISVFGLALGQDDCLPRSCGPWSPTIRFPFWIKGLQPESCGYEGFGVSCNESGRAELDLRFPLTASAENIVLPLNMTVTVWEIDYKAQKMLVGYARARSCLPERLPNVSSPSSSPFEVEALGYGGGSTLFNCSNTRGRDTVSCLSNRRYQVVEYGSTYEINSLIPYSSCFKMYNISYVPDGALSGTAYEHSSQFYLNWSRPSCGKCEERGSFCRLRNRITDAAQGETECFGGQLNQDGSSKKHKPLIAGIIIAGVILLALIVIALFFIFKMMKRKRDENTMIENAINKHKGMKPRRYTYAEIKRITRSFKEKLSKTSLHKGKLGDGTPVSVKVLDASQQSIEEFINEVGIIGRIQHPNILGLIGYCASVGKRALVYELLQGETLEALITSSRKQNQTLEWEKIARGVANGIECAHQESTKKILNLYLNPQDILLDHTFDPKILVATTSDDDGGGWGYVAPEAFSSSLSIIPEKAYAYGFGMLLLDMVGRNVDSFSSGIHFLDKRGEGAVEIEEEEGEGKGKGKGKGNNKKMLMVGLWCMQWFPSDRPSMKGVMEMLDQQSMPSVPPNPFDLTTQKSNTT